MLDPLLALNLSHPHNFAAVLPISGNATAQANVGYWGYMGKHVLALSLTAFGPTPDIGRVEIP
jgi:hypothetical protein